MRLVTGGTVSVALATTLMVCAIGVTHAGYPTMAAPPWTLQVPSRDYFESRITPQEDDRPIVIAPILGPALARLLEVEGRVRITRVLQTGQQFLSHIVLTHHPGDGSDVRMTLESQSGSSIVLELYTGPQGRRGARLKGGDGAHVLAAIPDLGAFDAFADLPISLGDFRIGDIVTFLLAASGESLHAMGRLTGRGARPLVVLGTAPLRSPDPGDFSALASSMLVALDENTREIRWVRVFDAGDRLVRVYDGFPAAEQRCWRLRATDLTVNSHSTAEIVP